MSAPITYEALRGLGFRIEWPEADGRPRMIIGTDRGECQKLELCPRSDNDWHCWLRNDMSHRRGKFIHIRPLRFIEEVEALLAAITGRPVVNESFDPDRFADALAKAKREGEVNWKRHLDRGHAQDFIARFS